MKTIITLTDSYKLTHHPMYVEGTEYVYSYFEARPGAKFPFTVFFGLQYLLTQLEGIVVKKEDIDYAEKLAALHFGNDKIFKRERWDYILEHHNGKLPIEICAVPEGTVVPINNILMTVVNTDPKCFWLTNHLETFLSHVWAPTTVATLSKTCKNLFNEFLTKTGSNLVGINFMLHDFGMRGTSSMETAGICGAGHLVNFMGTDTIIAMEYAHKYYEADLATLAYSVPASEHSVMTALGEDGEPKIIEHLLDTYPTGILSIVSDSYDIYRCVREYYGKQFKEKILARDGKLVVRPDSGDPIQVVINLLEALGTIFGITTNKKGYQVLNPKVGLLWGDGLDIYKIEEILSAMKTHKWAAENIVFGMGGGLLQKINRDTQRFAFKSSAQCRNGIWYDVYKQPIDTTKVSKKGKLKLVKDNGTFLTVNQNDPRQDLLIPIFRNGEILKRWTFDEIRKKSNE